MAPEESKEFSIAPEVLCRHHVWHETRVTASFWCLFNVVGGFMGAVTLGAQLHATSHGPSREPEGTRQWMEMMPSSNVIIDLSHHNQNLDFSKMKDPGGILGIIHKVTQGTKYVDPTYGPHKAAAAEAGLLWGAYHFGTGADGVEQALHFLEEVEPDGQTLLALDLEANPNGPSMNLEEARSFATHINEATGNWPVLYSGYYIKQLLGSNQDPILAQCPFWLAQYGPTAVVPANWQTWTLWQYTDGAAGPLPHDVAGAGLCDRDYYSGDVADLQAGWGGSLSIPQTEQA